MLATRITRSLRPAATAVRRTTQRSLATTTNDQKIQIEKISGSLGAELSNIDLTQQPLSPQTTATIRQALLEHGVIFFRGQEGLTRRQFLDFSARFGEPQEYPFVKGMEEWPEIIEVVKREGDRRNFGGVWHCDTLYLDEPPMGTMLLAKELPPYGGDTLFANQVAAYDALSEGLKATLSTLTAIHTSAKADVTKTREDLVSGNEQPQNYTSHHPAVRTHPETGRKSLYVNTAHTERFAGWTAEESRGLLEWLFAHQIRAEFTCRFRWGEGSLAFWDNRQVLHLPVNDYQGFRRRMERITLRGDRPV